MNLIISYRRSAIAMAAGAATRHSHHFSICAFDLRDLFGQGHHAQEMIEIVGGISLGGMKRAGKIDRDHILA
ncbi:MAG TPA: hypothetical protein VFF70_02195 [Anaerolineae bacterium]|nr:hypothetical protein [Anaerolineae bacterium]